LTKSTEGCNKKRESHGGNGSEEIENATCLLLLLLLLEDHTFLPLSPFFEKNG
jgi:hypothetical protein